MKKLGVLLFLIASLNQISIAQNDQDLENQMMEGLQNMMEQLQKNLNGNSMFFMDTLMMKGFENGMMPLDGNSFFFMDTLMIEGGQAMPGMPFGSDGLGLDLGKMMEEMQKGMQQMGPEDWEQLSKIFENLDFGGGQFMIPSPEELEKLQEQFSPPTDSTKQRRKTIKI